MQIPPLAYRPAFGAAKPQAARFGQNANHEEILRNHLNIITQQLEKPGNVENIHFLSQDPKTLSFDATIPGYSRSPGEKTTFKLFIPTHKHPREFEFSLEPSQANQYKIRYYQNLDWDTQVTFSKNSFNSTHLQSPNSKEETTLTDEVATKSSAKLFEAVKHALITATTDDQGRYRLKDFFDS